MGRHLWYKPGSFYRTSDRTGFPVRAEHTRRQWDNLIVELETWEPRQPQDLVKGVPDYQSVPDARPLAPNRFISALYFQMAETADVTSYVVFLDNIGGIGPGDPVGVVLDADGGAIFHTTINSVYSGYVILNAKLPGTASSGNLLVDYLPGGGTAGGVAPPLVPLLDSNGFPLTDSDGNLMFGSS